MSGFDEVNMFGGLPIVHGYLVQQAHGMAGTTLLAAAGATAAGAPAAGVRAAGACSAGARAASAPVAGAPAAGAPTAGAAAAAANVPPLQLVAVTTPAGAPPAGAPATAKQRRAVGAPSVKLLTFVATNAMSTKYCERRDFAKVMAETEAAAGSTAAKRARTSAPAAKPTKQSIDKEFYETLCDDDQFKELCNEAYGNIPAQDTVLGWLQSALETRRQVKYDAPGNERTVRRQQHVACNRSTSTDTTYPLGMLTHPCSCALAPARSLLRVLACRAQVSGTCEQNGIRIIDRQYRARPGDDQAEQRHDRLELDVMHLVVAIVEQVLVVSRLARGSSGAIDESSEVLHRHMLVHRIGYLGQLRQVTELCAAGTAGATGAAGAVGDVGDSGEAMGICRRSTSRERTSLCAASGNTAALTHKCQRVRSLMQQRNLP